jgi:glycosyltransferase involved in cell wall biosynthesis
MTPAPTVSVLTPVHNGAAYLDECIRSVVAQTFRSWELIVVDNRSTDDTAAIARRYAAADERIRCLSPDAFLGVYGNHNRAIEAMDPRSRYCKFVHADDWIYPQCLERMVDVAERNPGVGVVSAYRLEGTVVEHSGLLPYTQEVMPGREVIRHALSSAHWVTGSPTSLLLRADLVRGAKPFFDESVWHGDTDAAYRLLMRSELGFVHQLLTFTRLHPQALTSFSHQANTYLPHAGRMLIRYGAEVLGPQGYRKAMRTWLRQYGWYLSKQMLKPRRHRDARFHAFHRAEIERLRAELGDDREFQLALGLFLLLLKRPGGEPAKAAGAAS